MNVCHYLFKGLNKLKTQINQLIATGLATCLTICQIPAWAQVQGQRPKILASESQAKNTAEISLLVWKPQGYSVGFLLPHRVGHSPVQSVNQYLEKVQTVSDLKNFWMSVPEVRAQDLSLLNIGAKDFVVALQANHLTDHRPASSRVRNFLQRFGVAESSGYILPVAAAIALSSEERLAFEKLVAEQIPFLVAMGGADVDPRYYREQNRDAIDPNSTRDHFEISLIQQFVDRGRGFLFGVCRGHQISSVALGLRLHQDVEKELSPREGHRESRYHEVQILQTENNLLRRILRNRLSIPVNSLHHQSVRWQTHPLLEISAISSSGVVEAIEFKNQRGLLTQFHPELMRNSDGDLMMKGVAGMALDQTVRSCRRVHQK